MLSLAKNICKVTCRTSNLRFVSLAFIGGNSVPVAEKNTQIILNKRLLHSLCREFNEVCNVQYKLHSPLELKRYFSKKKGSKRTVEEEESDSEQEEEYEEGIDEIGDSLITKSVSSIRVDTILKAGLGINKKKIEQEFYAFKLRVNGNKVLKKSMNIYVGDEIDRIRDFSPDTKKFLIVDRVIIRGIGSLTGSGMFPVKMEVFKQLTIENYEDPWSPSNLGEI